jgi:hypothetical protein
VRKNDMLPSPGTRERGERAASAGAKLLRRSATGRLDYRSPRDQTVDDDDYRDHQENMDQATANVHHKES